MRTGAQAPGSATDTAREVAAQTADATGRAASDVKDTATDQARRVVGEAKDQARTVAAEMRDKVGGQVRTQNDKLVGGIRRMADELEEMGSERADSPAASVVSRVADGGRQFADYLEHHGPDGVLREVQEFARRRPGAFLATALAAGFVVGRLGKSVAKADEAPSEADRKPLTDSFVSPATSPAWSETSATYTEPATYAETPAYTEPVYAPPSTTGSTNYAATGTGTPVPLDDPYAEPGYRGDLR
jgi:hypothetical protein